jgi:signal transduction histidine kinase
MEVISFQSSNSTLKRITKDLSIAIGFGLLTLIFGQIQFNIPGVEGGVTSLNEIPSLISVFYLSNPLYLIIVSATGSLGTPPDGSALSTFLFHTGGLIPFWYYYKMLLKNKELTLIDTAGRTALGVILYYIVLIIPLMIVTNKIFGINNEDFGTFYMRLVRSTSFELTATTIITTLYLLLWNANTKLKDHLHVLEKRVKERTVELDKTIAKLNQTNQELEAINESLDSMVQKRTQELENRNIQLTGYAFINSHLLRAPLARLLGLSAIIRNELQSLEDIELLEKFLLTCNELDKIVKLMSEFLTADSILSKRQLDELQERIRQIAVEIKAIT